MEQRHNRQKQPQVAMKTSSTPKPFKKDRIYSIKPEDRHLLKRKRGSNTKRTSSSNHEAYAKESGIPKVARKESRASSRANMQGKSIPQAVCQPNTEEVGSMVSSKSPPVINLQPQSIAEVYAAGQASGMLRKSTSDTPLNSL
jgi:hypothetical protein